MGVAFLSFRNSKSFSKGVKFRSRYKAFRLLLLFTTSCEEVKLRLGLGASMCIFPVRFKVLWFSFKAVLCLLMWPPKAWPIANSRPQTEHSWDLGFVGEPCDCESRFPWSPINLGFLWLARWPPSAWNDWNCRLHVLHSKTRLGDVLVKASISPAPWESRIKQFAMDTLSNSLCVMLLLFMAKQIGLAFWEIRLRLNWFGGFFLHKGLNETYLVFGAFIFIGLAWFDCYFIVSWVVWLLCDKVDISEWL